MGQKTITIAVLVDVVGALAADTLKGNIYLVDNNKDDGSLNEGTEILQTVVEEGDQIIWNTLPIEPEAFGSITGIIINDDFCEPEQKNYEGSDITYWTGTVKDTQKDKYIHYSLKIKLGSREEEFITESSPCFILRKKE